MRGRRISRTQLLSGDIFETSQAPGRFEMRELCRSPKKGGSTTLSVTGKCRERVGDDLACALRGAGRWSIVIQAKRIPARQGAGFRYRVGKINARRSLVNLARLTIDRIAEIMKEAARPYVSARNSPWNQPVV
jgi:hypothetical protein